MRETERKCSEELDKLAAISLRENVRLSTVPESAAEPAEVRLRATRGVMVSTSA